MKLVHAPHLNQSIVVGGRKRPVSYNRRKRLCTVLRASLPSPPASTNYETPAMTALRQMYLNDKLGCCVCAGRGHRIGVLTANSLVPFVYSDAQILTEYERIGKYNPADPSTDQGCDMATAADDGVSHGYADGSKDLGWVDVDATNKTEVMQAIDLFEDGDIGFELPDAWLQSMPSGNDFVWDVAGDPNPENGHCVQIVDYDTVKGVRISTWGLLGWLTWPALAKYGAKSAYGEVIIHINPDQMIKASQKAPNGVAWTELISDFDSMGGHVTAPTPAPVTPPAPVPSLGVTQAQAEAAVDAALSKSTPVMTRAMAKKAANSGLSTIVTWSK